ncbi:MAG TPA: hypothetical protein V6D11_31330 [Waterburya sp.]|jgi:hypothetical protein
MKKSHRSTQKLNQELSSTLESPFCEKNGLLEFREGLTQPEFLANWSFVTNLYGEQVQVDHFVLLFPHLSALENYAEVLRGYSAQMVEGPGLFPLDFCPDTYTMAEDLCFYLLTMLMPTGGLVVLASPHLSGDQLDRFLHARGRKGVHHVAIRVEDIHRAALQWQKKGFQPLSETPLESDSLCQWSWRNSVGQIIELIHRYPDNKATFSCQNIGGLRRLEVAR